MLFEIDWQTGIFVNLNGVVAQLAERYLCKVKDVGSSPTNSTDFIMDGLPSG
jgi:hypothetical protein